MPMLPQPQTWSTGPVGTMPGPQQPQSRSEGRSPTLLSVSSLTLSHHSQDLPLGEGPLAEVPPLNVPHHVLPRSPLVPIMEHSTITGFSPNSASTLFWPLRDEPLPIYPVTSPAREAPSAFMQP